MFRQKPKPSEQELLFKAIENLNFPAIKEMLERIPALVKCKDEKGNTPLHKAAALGYVSAVTQLVYSGADMYAKNVQGFTPLQLAKNSKPRSIFVDIKNFEDTITTLVVLEKASAERAAVFFEVLRKRKPQDSCLGQIPDGINLHIISYILGRKVDPSKQSSEPTQSSSRGK